MFTGIIEEKGIIKQIVKGEKSSIIAIQANKVLEGTNIGDSIAVNGICLTVTNINNSCFSADVMAETMRRTNLGNQSEGSKVNLERALTPLTRMGGHIVSGHIDGTGKIINYLNEENAIWVTIETKIEILKYIVEKGSIAIDGISLTVAYVDNNCFKVSIIPHTSQETTLIDKNIGDTVNLECDIIAKYVEKLVGLKKDNENINDEISEEILIEYGFM